MASQRIGFVLLGDTPESGADAVYDRAEDALNGNPALTQVGKTSQGLLWRYEALPPTGLAATNPDGGPVRAWILGGLGFVFLLTLLLFYLGEVLYTVPWAALGIELTDSYDERTALFAGAGVAQTVSTTMDLKASEVTARLNLKLNGLGLFGM